MQTIASLRPGADRVDRRARCSAAACGRRGAPASRSSRLLVRDGDRIAARGRGSTSRSSRTSSSPVSTSSCSARSSCAARAALQISTNPRVTRSSSDEESGETMHTGRIVPVYEKTGTRDAEDAAARSCTEALQQLPDGRCRIRCPRTCVVRQRLPSRGAALHGRRIFRRRTSRVDELNRVRDAGAAAPDLRGVLPLPARAAARGATARRPSARRARSRSTIASANRRGAVLPFKLTGGQKQRARARSSTTCSGRSR